MTVQLQVAYSKSIIGSGVVAGGPYYCAANNPFFFEEICRGQNPLVPLVPSLMVDAAKRFARDSRIDPLINLRKRHVYVFSGIGDTVVKQRAVDATASFFQKIGVEKGNLMYVHDVPAGHALITSAFGNDCPVNDTPYISHCLVKNVGYDQAGEILKHIYGPLNPPAPAPTGQIVVFNQRAFADEFTGMAEDAFLYVPPGCTATGTHCKVHVALHGCLQAAESIGDKFYTDSGYNNWADSNNILVLYPQVNISGFLPHPLSPYNPGGCWDWLGYTGPNYATKKSSQMTAIMAMVNRLTQAR